ncbi:leucine-rich repeat-containing protein c10orf11 homolog [Plakobranchus ocellatus]|uniref:Leucine-rich repeat-containing protein c10orf11 homolog n=1 Tax=Plakobranchus ocellatus TaxID=259542 RepID=A0AAV3XW57_9GAST|nr:leucine-rich repeat-containing protein c10orf11 homolog [Plakobranchus ocellatus]
MEEAGRSKENTYLEEHKAARKVEKLMLEAEEKKRSVSCKFNNFFLVVIHFGSTRHEKRAMQQSKARNVSSRLCRAVNGVCNSKSLCFIFFRTRAMCCVPCAECHVTSMEDPPKLDPTLKNCIKKL